MKKAFKRQVIRGILGLAVSIGIFIAFNNLFDLSTDDSKLFRYILLLIITPIFFGFLFYIFAGKPSFIYGSKLGFSFIAFTIMMYELPQPYSGILIVILAIVFLVWPKIKEYLNENRQPSEKDIIRMENQIEIEKQEALADNEFKASIGFGKKTLLLCTPSGGIYQVVSGEDKYYFISVGGQFSGIDADLLITDFSDESRYITNKKDYVVNKKDITAVSIIQKNLSNYPLPQSGVILISLRSGKKKHIILDSVDLTNVDNFFGGIANIKTAKKSFLGSEGENEPDLSRIDKDVLHRLKKICLVLNVIGVIAPAIFLFVGFYYKLLSSICILIPLVILCLYFKFNKILSLEGEKSTVIHKNKIMMEMSLFPPVFALCIRSIIDFNLIELKTMILWSISIFIIFMITFLLFTKEYKTRKSAALVIALTLIFYVPSAIVQVNYLFDHSEPIAYFTNVMDMYTDTGSKMPDEYLLTVDLQSGKQIDMKVSKSFYEKTQKGQQVGIIEKTGFLKIKYAYIME